MTSIGNQPPSSNDDAPFEVFYDEDCPLCRREIEMIRKKDRINRLSLTDISADNFDAAKTGKTLDELMREIHGRYADGTIVVGVDVFREIYSRIGFGFLVGPSRVWGLRWAIDRFYDFFAALRYRSALKRLNKRVCKIRGVSDSPPERLKAFPDRNTSTNSWR